MTGIELTKAALALFAETDTADYEELALVYINLLLAEVFDANNRIRRHAGKEALAEIPSITVLGDVLPTEDRLNRIALPYGLAAKLYFDEDENPRLTMFLQEYQTRLSACDRWVVAF